MGGRERIKREFLWMGRTSRWITGRSKIVQPARPCRGVKCTCSATAIDDALWENVAVDSGVFFIPFTAAMLVGGFGSLIAGWKTPWR